VSEGDVAGDAESGRRPIYSIGAVARMLAVETATLRAWEERYRVVVPARSKGDQRLYSRDELEHLRFVVDLVAAGTTPADAHRLLAERAVDVGGLVDADRDRTTIVVLLAERDRYAAELLEYFLRTEGYEVCVARDAERAEQLFAEQRPQLSIVELMMTSGGLELCTRLSRGAPVLAMSALDLADEALVAGASAFLAKPVVPLQFVSTVRDLLGSSALTRRSGAPVG
jgi:DNA-binding transcriptional MerR regulator